MGKVTDFTGITRLPIPVDWVLDAARKAGLTEIVIIGYDAEEQEYFASSQPDAPSILWLLERCKTELLNQPEDD